jgi:hypothetical protein
VVAIDQPRSRPQRLAPVLGRITPYQSIADRNSSQLNHAAPDFVPTNDIVAVEQVVEQRSGFVAGGAKWAQLPL